MLDQSYYQGQRLSLKSQTCTVRFIGKVTGKQGEWLGVEWNDDSRGKHDGSHDGVRYFQCQFCSQINDQSTYIHADYVGRSHSATAASFLRPEQNWDQSRTFVQALSKKYFQQDEARTDEIIYVSRSKRMEEVGFEKFAQRQAELRGINVIVLDDLCIHHVAGEIDGTEIESLCSQIVDLDLGDNLFETWDVIVGLCSHIPRLERLGVKSNRFSVSNSNAPDRTLQSIRVLDLSNTYLREKEVSQCLTATPNLRELSLAQNGLQSWIDVSLTSNLRTVDLSRNRFISLADVQHILKMSSITSIKLQHNQITTVLGQASTQSVLSSYLQDLDLGHNEIALWTFLDDLRTALPALKHLRITGNPIFENLQSADHKPLGTADGYMLAVARLPQLVTLNYSTITDKERLNAEKYYLSQIALQLSLSKTIPVADVLRQHPLWSTLCHEYGEPEIKCGTQSDLIDPKSLAARLVTIDLYLADPFPGQPTSLKWSVRIPKAFNIYAFYGMIGEKLKVMPLKLQLVLETEEKDPVGRVDASSSPEWWDSDEEDTNDSTEQALLINRAVELVPGTRSLATYIDGQSATVRVEWRDIRHLDHRMSENNSQNTT